MNIEKIFAIPIFKQKINDHIIDEVILKVKKFIDEKNFNGNFKNELVTTFYDDKNFLVTIEAYDLLNELAYNCRLFLDKLGFNERSDIVITSWLQLNQPKSDFKRHDHYGALISGCIYLNVTEGGELVFYTPLEVRRLTNAFFEGVKVRDNIYNQNELAIKPSNGDLILFESWLQHSVKQNISNNNRISIGLNVWVEKPNETL